MVGRPFHGCVQYLSLGVQGFMNFDKCTGCGVILETPLELNGTPRPPCPACGSTARILEASIAEVVGVTDTLGFEQKRKGFKSGGRKRPVAEGIEGWCYSVSEQDWVHFTRFLDREQDHYRERIVTKDGRVLREVSERLSDHRGRGTAKFKQ